MSIVDHHGEVEYPFSQKTVFKAIMEAAPNINGLSLDSADEISGRITFKAGVSLASWGENIPVQLIKVAPARTQMKIMSTPKTGVMFGGAMDFGKNQQNIDKIINAVSAVLANYPSEAEPEQKVDVVEQLTKLKQLVDQGVLTEEEFAEQKKKILEGTSQISAAMSVPKETTPEEENPIRIEGSGEGNSSNYAMIALVVFIIVFLLLMLASCNGPLGNSAEIEKKYQDSLAAVRKELKEAKSKIQLLSFPADKRLLHITELFNAQEYDKAKKEIAELKNLFPYASENAECSKMLEQISTLEAAKKAEEERIKALGFKALSTEQNVTIGENKIAFSNLKIGPKYTHDVYPTYSGSEWREHTADKGSSFISYNMDITSTSKDPNIPTIAFYSVDGARLVHQITFWVNFARWSDYGCYLGNEPDLKNDFSKVNTVKFRVGAQLEDSYFKKPYVVVLKKSNTLSRHYERFENPPVSYIGEAGYPATLTIDNFNNGQYIAIKLANF